MNLSLAMVLSLERPMRESRVGGATRAIAASGAIGSLCARDGAILVVRDLVYDVLCFVRDTSLRFRHSHEKTIEIIAKLEADGDWNVRASVLNTMCSLAF